MEFMEMLVYLKLKLDTFQKSYYFIVIMLGYNSQTTYSFHHMKVIHMYGFEKFYKVLVFGTSISLEYVILITSLVFNITNQFRTI